MLMSDELRTREALHRRAHVKDLSCLLYCLTSGVP